MRRVALGLGMALFFGTGLAAQDAARADYFRSVASFFNLPANEVAILSDWDIAAAEIPVVLFMARRAGVSPEALVALRSAGQSWAELAARYRVGPAALHVPVRDEADARVLAEVYQGFRTTPVGDWARIRLTDAHIIGLVNVRVLSQALNLPPERVLAASEPGVPWVALHARLSR
ncbi:MAG: hypothetical protein AAF389_16920 [Gemmatimonadota bacterium]